MKAEELVEKIINSKKLDEIIKFILSNQTENHSLQNSQVFDDFLESYSQLKK